MLGSNHAISKFSFASCENAKMAKCSNCAAGATKGWTYNIYVLHSGRPAKYIFGYYI